MKKNNSHKVLILTIIGVILLVVFLIFILNYSKDDSSFSLLEKKWIKDNVNNVIDVSIYNDVPLYGENGTGISFDFLNEFTKKYGINFNKVSYLSNSSSTYNDVAFKIVNSDKKLSNEDILLYKDNYVVISTEKSGIDKISDLSNLEIALLEEDMSLVSYYLVDAKDVKYIPYKNVNDIMNKFKKKEISYAIIPETLYLDEIIKSDLNILFHVSDMSKQYVLNISNNETLLNIMKKYYLQFQENFDEYYNNNLLMTISNALNITALEKSSYNSESYVYGYVVNMPYENIENNNFVGTISNYLSRFEDIFDVDFKIVRYDNVKELRKALSEGKVDIAFSNFNVDGTNIDKIYSVSPFKEEYVVLATNPFVVNSVRSLKDKEVYTVANTYLDDFLVSNNVKTKGFKDTDSLLKNVNNNSLIVIDSSTYDYYKNQKLSDYKVLFSGVLDKDYQFVIRDVDKNTTFSKLFNTYISTVDYNNIKFDYNTNSTISDADFIKKIIKYLIICLFFVMGIIIILGANKKRKKEKNSGKDDKFKFIDIMTSLKNRNYLNQSVHSWEENVIYPQAIIIIDLNNIKDINDNFGHEEGDNEIKKAAAILINNQLEKTDIVRTDGNEFLIYMVGYEEKEVVAYMKKIYRELKELPHKYGASVGYSMILDDIKSIDDAINEATLEMRKQKENK